jgi:hypothetical protein
MSLMVIKAFRDLFMYEISCNDNEMQRVKDHLHEFMGQLHELSHATTLLPWLYADNWAAVGDYGRNTHTKPIKHIDVLVCMGWKSTALHYNTDTYAVYAGDESGRFVEMRDEENRLDPNLISQRFVEHLETFNNAKGVAVAANGGFTFREKGYLWLYNIRPAFFLKEEDTDEVFYLVPNGKNHWKPIFPLQQSAQLDVVNQAHGGFMIDLIRYMKHWNREQTIPKIPASLLEAIVFNYCETKSKKLTEFADLDIAGALQAIRHGILEECIDPIGARGDLNTMVITARQKVSSQAFADQLKAQSARHFEQNGNYARSIDKWSEVFGPEFKKHAQKH